MDARRYYGIRHNYKRMQNDHREEEESQLKQNDLENECPDYCKNHAMFPNVCVCAINTYQMVQKKIDSTLDFRIF